MTSLPLSILLTLFLTACAASAAAPVPTVDTIDGRRVESLTIRRPDARAVVVFEAGSRNTLDQWGTMLDAASRDATVFAYNRPGYGASETVASRRDGRTIVEELRQVLRAKGLLPPYVLVGHSLGGLYMQLFARAYRHEVLGIVLVDALYPRMVKATADFPLMTRIAGRLAFSCTVWQEIERIDETGEQVLALDAIDDTPIVRLVNVPRGRTAIPVDFGAFRVDAGMRGFVDRLYPNAKTVVVDASHQMQLERPDVVAAAIRDVIAAAHAEAAYGKRPATP